MQILVTLSHVIDVENPAEKEKERISSLHKLLIKLKEEGYHINSLLGNLIFDHAKKEVIDIGEKGHNAKASEENAKLVFKAGAGLAIIFTDKKYVVFTNRFVFICLGFSQGRELRPLRLEDVLNNFDSLIKNEDQERLNALYHESFLEFRKASEKELKELSKN